MRATDAAIADYHRHDISDRIWQRLEPLLPGGPGKVGRPAQNNRRFINAVFRILRTGAPWRDLPPDYGPWNQTNLRFCRWRDRGVWAQLRRDLADDPDFEWLMIDAGHIKARRHGADARGGNQAVGGAKEPAPYLMRGAEYETASGGGRSRNAGADAGYGGNCG